MNGKTVDLRQILSFLETVQEFVDTNPNEASTLADSALLIEAVYADLNPRGGAMSVNTSAYTQIIRLVGIAQEFVDTNPNEVSTLAESALLVEAMCADLRPREGALVN
jgi:hypothetical protein